MSAPGLPPRLGAIESPQDLTVRDIQELQAEFDRFYWTGPSGPSDRRRHILFHLVHLAGKLAKVEERADHAVDSQQGTDEAIADLLVYAAQLAQIEGHELGALWLKRLEANSERLPRAEHPRRA